MRQGRRCSQQWFSSRVLAAASRVRLAVPRHGDAFGSRRVHAQTGPARLSCEHSSDRHRGVTLLLRRSHTRSAPPDLTQRGLADALTTWFGPLAAAYGMSSVLEGLIETPPPPCLSTLCRARPFLFQAHRRPVIPRYLSHRPAEYFRLARALDISV